MAIQDILQALEDQANADINAVLAEAREHAALIEQQAEAEAAALREGYHRQVEKSASSRASKAINAARLEAKMTVSSARGHALDEAFSAAAGRLEGIRRQPGYDELFSRLLDEALEGIEGRVDLHVDPSDVDLATAAAAQRGIDAGVLPDLASAGGVVVTAREGRLSRRNSVEDRLERARPYIQADVARVLFE